MNNTFYIIHAYYLFMSVRDLEFAYFYEKEYIIRTTTRLNTYHFHIELKAKERSQGYFSFDVIRKRN